MAQFAPIVDPLSGNDRDPAAQHCFLSALFLIILAALPASGITKEIGDFDSRHSPGELHAARRDCCSFRGMVLLTGTIEGSWVDARAVSIVVFRSAKERPFAERKATIDPLQYYSRDGRFEPFPFRGGSFVLWSTSLLTFGVRHDGRFAALSF